MSISGSNTLMMVTGRGYLSSAEVCVAGTYVVHGIACLADP